MNKRVLAKPDGRQLILYGRHPIEGAVEVPSPSAEPFAPNSHLRWHPLRGEWVAYATHRQTRTFQPSAGSGYDPLAETRDPARPTELPAGSYDVAVFDNLFPTFSAQAHDAPALAVPTQPGRGACEVVVYSRDPATSLGALPLWHVDLVLQVWADRYRDLSARDDIAYVFPFENRGAEVGVTLHHPHGQIYGYPFVPPIPARALQQACDAGTRGPGLLERIIDDELRARKRLLYVGEHAVAFVPLFARYAFECWVLPRARTASLADLGEPARLDLARALKTVLMTLDALWGHPMPYVMPIYQAPTDGRPHPESHLHFEIYPSYRMAGRLKFLAGSELGAGVFTADTDPDASARQLQSVSVPRD